MLEMLEQLEIEIRSLSQFKRQKTDKTSHTSARNRSASRIPCRSATPFRIFERKYPRRDDEVQRKERHMTSIP